MVATSGSTVTACVHEDSLPASSVAVQVTALIPCGNAVDAVTGRPPNVGIKVTALQLSDVVGTPKSTFVAVQEPSLLAMTGSMTGQVMEGGV